MACPLASVSSVRVSEKERTTTRAEMREISCAACGCAARQERGERERERERREGVREGGWERGRERERGGE